MKRFLLWLISVALGVVVLLAAVMGVSYAFTTEGGCPDGAAQFGGQALEPNGPCCHLYTFDADAEYEEVDSGGFVLPFIP